jgi:prolipoprotein diacylglyceryl transferase
VRPLLFTLTCDSKICVGAFLTFLIVALAVAMRAGLGFRRSLLAALAASLSFGMFGGKKKGEKGPDLLIPGALATISGPLPLAYLARTGTPFSLPVAAYPTVLAVAFLIGIIIVHYRARARGIDPAHVLDLAIVCLVAGPIGARAFFVAQFWDRYFTDKPAELILGDLDVAALTSSDELFVNDKHVRFQGGETTYEAVKAELDAAGIRTRLITSDRRKRGNEIEHLVRGLAIESEQRGHDAALRATGSAAEKLQLAEEAEGKIVPALEVFKIWNGGLVFYGGLILAALACIAYIRMRGYRIWLVADAIAPVLPLGYAIARMGCFLNGCCWGTEVDEKFPLAVRFPPFSFAWLQHAHCAIPPAFDAMLDRRELPHDMSSFGLAEGSHFVHPVQLYGLVLYFAIFVAVVIYGRRARREGQTFFLFLALEPIARFVTEHWRGDHDQFHPLLGYPFTVSQIVALLTFPIGVAGFLWCSKHGRDLSEPKAPLPG